jgi:arsenite-transporting ATPase
VNSQSFIDDLLQSKKFLLVTGKGGIGKTLLTCALAKRAEALGRRVLVVEQSAVEQVGPLLGLKDIGHEELWSGNLGAANFTAGGNFRDFITKHLMKSSLLDVILSNKIVHSFFTTIPGFAELMLLGRIYYAMNESPKLRPDLIIMDAYASGHFMSLMTTPDAVLKSGLAGPIVRLTTMVRDWLADSKLCGTIYVGIPEELVVNETLDFLPQLIARSPVALSAVVMNRCLTSLNANGSRSAAFSFLDERLRRQAAALSRFAESKAQSDKLRLLPLILLPELGSISEPLDETTVSRLFGGAS